MLKVLAFVASCSVGERSRTARYADALAARLREEAQSRGEEVEYERVLGSELRVEYCRSCNNCFFRGPCPLDDKDDMPVLKHKLRQADIILFGTPVYVGEMSGIAKSVLDRIACWAHRFELAGKVGYAFATTSASFGPDVSARLGGTLRYYGLAVAETGYAVTTFGEPNIFRQDQLDPQLEREAKCILDAWQDIRSAIAPLQEDAFTYMKRSVLSSRACRKVVGIEPTEDIKVCEQRNVVAYKTFADYAASIQERARESHSLV